MRVSVSIFSAIYGSSSTSPVDAHVARDGVDIDCVAAGRDDTLDDRLVAVKAVLAQHDDVALFG